MELIGDMPQQKQNRGLLGHGQRESFRERSGPEMRKQWGIRGVSSPVAGGSLGTSLLNWKPNRMAYPNATWGRWTFVSNLQANYWDCGIFVIANALAIIESAGEYSKIKEKLQNKQRDRSNTHVKCFTDLLGQAYPNATWGRWTFQSNLQANYWDFGIFAIANTMAIIESAGNYAKIKQKLQNVEPTAAFRLVCVKQILKHCMALKTGALKFAPPAKLPARTTPTPMSSEKENTAFGRKNAPGPAPGPAPGFLVLVLDRQTREILPTFRNMKNNMESSATYLNLDWCSGPKSDVLFESHSVYTTL
ncbi:hypothetical protein HRR75_006547 [Exophiala dermatitidis]|nr:hypothetical protein HRR75_006547 [Exophiala dermatitidis]